MNRRRFLRSVALGASAVVAAPLLPFVPPPPANLGISIRFIRQFEIQPDTVPRLDILYGMSVLNPEFACRVSA